MIVHVEPTNTHPMPYMESPDLPINFEQALHTAVNTQTVLEQLGAIPEVDAKDVQSTTNLIDKALKEKDGKALNNPMVAFGAKEFLRAYSARLAMEVADVRSALTNKLLELANCGDPRFELKAIELLGKHSDVALFTERSEVTINYKNSSDLESAIKERISRLLKSNVVDVDAKAVSPSTSKSIEDEFGPAIDRTQNDGNAD